MQLEFKMRHMTTSIHIELIMDYYGRTLLPIVYVVAPLLEVFHPFLENCSCNLVTSQFRYGDTHVPRFFFKFHIRIGFQFPRCYHKSSTIQVGIENLDSFILIIKNRPNDVYIGCDGITNLRSINDFLIGGTHA